MISLLGEQKIRKLVEAVRDTAHLPGSLAELGVYRGGGALAMLTNAPDKTIHLFDTFAGMPEQGPLDVHKVGDFADTSLSSVEALFEKKAAVFHVGLFSATCLEASAEKFACVHLDADQYQVTKDGLEFFYPRMSEGGKIILDDWGWTNCPGVKIATLEFLEGKPETVKIIGPCQAMIEKI